MGLLHVAGALALAASAVGQKLAEFKSPTANILYRIAVPDSAPPYDVLVQIVAPVGTGWAGLAFGGGMLNNPLVVAWPNGQSAMVSPRWAT